MNRKHWLIVLGILLLLALLAVCVWPKKNCEQAHNDERTYRLQVCTDKKKYGFGEPVHITFTVTNVSDESLVLDGGDKPAMDIDVQGEYWSEGQELTPELARVTLEPGESRVIEWTWPTPSTDLQALKDSFGPPGVLSNFVSGSVIPLPGASPRAVWVFAEYRTP